MLKKSICSYRNEEPYSPKWSCEGFKKICARQPPTTEVSKFMYSLKAVFVLRETKTLNSQDLKTTSCYRLAKISFWLVLRIWSCVTSKTKSSHWYFSLLIFNCLVNPLTPKIWLLILPSSCYTFPCKLVMGIWCLIKISTSTWYIWTFSLHVCWIM